MFGIVGYWPGCSHDATAVPDLRVAGLLIPGQDGDISSKSLQDFNTASLDASSENINTFIGNVC